MTIERREDHCGLADQLVHRELLASDEQGLDQLKQEPGREHRAVEQEKSADRLRRRVGIAAEIGVRRAVQVVGGAKPTNIVTTSRAAMPL